MQVVTEITLNHEFLMSSLHTDSEQALAEVALAQLSGSQLRVLIGGLGLGYTAHAALQSDRVVEVEVVEYLPQVIQWMNEGLVPLADELTADRRLVVNQGDIYGRLAAPAETRPFDAILIDVDHSPDDRLAAGDADFYTVDGIARAARHLRTRGVLALWSYAEHSPLLDAMRAVLADVRVHPITYFNRHVHEEFTDWLYVGTRA